MDNNQYKVHAAYIKKYVLYFNLKYGDDGRMWS
jgi:hypothetical protein